VRFGGECILIVRLEQLCVLCFVESCALLKVVCLVVGVWGLCVVLCLLGYVCVCSMWMACVWCVLPEGKGVYEVDEGVPCCGVRFMVICVIVFYVLFVVVFECVLACGWLHYVCWAAIATEAHWVSSTVTD